MSTVESNKMIIEVTKVGPSTLNIGGIRSNRELRQALLNMLPDNSTKFLLFETSDIADIQMIEAVDTYSTDDANKLSEMHQVQKLGEAIGYGNLMSWASALWRRHLKEKGFPVDGAFVPRIGEITPAEKIYDQYIDVFKGELFDVIIGGKGFNIGDRIKVNTAYSILHYNYGMPGDTIKDMEGLTGVIIARSAFDKYTVCDVKVDAPWDKHYKNGMTRLCKEDIVEHFEVKEKED